MSVKKIVLLDKKGEVVDSFEKEAVAFDSSNIYPVVVENYLWDKDQQLKSAEEFKDKIERVYDKEGVPEETRVMLQDDYRRMKLIKTFDYGHRVLEVGCSQGTASIKIAELPEVDEVVGIDIRRSAIDEGNKLIKKLVENKEITQTVADKIKLEHLRIEDLPENHGKYNSICAYEVFEHMAPQDFLPAFQHLYKFIENDGTFFISVPNRFPNKKYDELGRTRWRWHDHRNFFSKISLEMFLSNFFEQVKFYPLYEEETVEDSIYLICECKGKKYD